MVHLTVLSNQDARINGMRIPVAEGENLLDSLLQNGVPLSHDCGGTVACATCCIIVQEGRETLDPAGEDEQDILDKAFPSEPGSRLACQAVAGGGDLVIEIPQDDAPRMASLSCGTALPVALTERAAQHFAAQIAKRAGAAVLRLAVRPAGCSGFSYRVDYAEAIDARDTVFESGGIRIAVDPESLPFVQGTTLDLVKEGLARRLRFDNPNARQTCGCGESFGT